MNALAEKYLLELLGHCSDACNSQVGKTQRVQSLCLSRRGSSPKSVHDSAGTFTLLLLGMPKLELLHGRM